MSGLVLLEIQRREDWKGLIMIKHLITKKLCKGKNKELFKFCSKKIMRGNKKGKILHDFKHIFMLYYL